MLRWTQSWTRVSRSDCRRRCLDPANSRLGSALGAWDRRTVAAVRYAAALPSERWWVVHVAADDEAALELGRAWMAGPGGDPPLEVLDDDGGVAATLAASTADRLRDFDEVVVVVGELVMPGVLRRVLHDNTADAIVEDKMLAGGTGLDEVCPHLGVVGVDLAPLGRPARRHEGQ